MIVIEYKLVFSLWMIRKAKWAFFLIDHLRHFILNIFTFRVHLFMTWAWYLFECPIRLNNSWLNVLQKIDVHQLEVVYVKFLHSSWSYYRFICIKAVDLLFLYYWSLCHLFLIIFHRRLLLEYTLLFSFNVYRKLIDVTFL